jgi:hypothetical protein
MSTPLPVRLRISRSKGARLISPNGLPIVSVTRPSRWVNHWRLRRQASLWIVYRPDSCIEYTFQTHVTAIGECVALYRADLLAGTASVSVRDVLDSLANKNLACWCDLKFPCHADTLLCVARGLYS